MTKNKSNKLQDKKLTEKERIKKKKELEQIKHFKDNYFAYYDDIKDYTRGKEDW